MGWKVEFYSTKVEQAIELWPPKLRAHFTWIVIRIEEDGPAEVGMPHIKSLRKGLFEIRAHSFEGIGRALFCIQKDKIVLILSEFIKKTQELPQRELELATKRMKEVKNND